MSLVSTKAVRTFKWIEEVFLMLVGIRREIIGGLVDLTILPSISSLSLVAAHAYSLHSYASL